MVGSTGVRGRPRAARAMTTRDAFLGLVTSDDFLRRVVLHAVNHRVQDFPDPLTATLVLMATSPLQFVLCETGLLLFKTNLLPVAPYALLRAEESQALRGLIDGMAPEQLHETVESSGQYTLTVLPFTQNLGRAPTVHLLCKRALLCAFVGLLQQQPPPQDVNRTLCNIVLQRFWSRVPTSSDIVDHVMRQLGAAATAAAAAEGGGTTTEAFSGAAGAAVESV